MVLLKTTDKLSDSRFGYSFCAEHEFGAKRIKQLLNISVEDHPVGLEGRMSKAPVDADRLVFGEYQDIRTERIGPGKAVKDKEKAAFLICATRWQMDDIRSAMAEGKLKREVIESNHPELNGIKTLDELKEIFKEKRTMKP